MGGPLFRNTTMKIMKHSNPDFAKLVACAGSDKKKPAYRVVHYDSLTKRLVSSDGTRMFVTNSLKFPETEGNYDITAYAAKEEFVPTKTEFPKWTALLSKDYDYEVTYTVPEFVKKLTPKNKLIVTLDAKTTEGTVITVVRVGGSGQGSVAINLSLLKPWAEETVRLLLSVSGKPTILLPNVGQPVTDPMEFKSFAVFAQANAFPSHSGIVGTRLLT